MIDQVTSLEDVAPVAAADVGGRAQGSVPFGLADPAHDHLPDQPGRPYVQ